MIENDPLMSTLSRLPKGAKRLVDPTTLPKTVEIEYPELAVDGVALPPTTYTPPPAFSAVLPEIEPPATALPNARPLTSWNELPLSVETRSENIVGCMSLRSTLILA